MGIGASGGPQDLHSPRGTAPHSSLLSEETRDHSACGFSLGFLSIPLASGWLLDYSCVVPQRKMPQTILKILGTCEPAKGSPACSLVRAPFCWGIPFSTLSAPHFFPLFWEASSPFSLLNSFYPRRCPSTVITLGINIYSLFDFPH